MPPSLVQDQERIMVNTFHSQGWDAFMLHPPKSVHRKDDLPLRHGVTIMSRFNPLIV